MAQQDVVAFFFHHLLDAAGNLRKEGMRDVWNDHADDGRPPRHQTSCPTIRLVTDRSGAFQYFFPCSVADLSISGQSARHGHWRQAKLLRDIDDGCALLVPTGRHCAVLSIILTG